MKLCKDEIVHFLKSDGKEAESLYANAREIRRAYFDNQVFLYGFVYFSTWCRNNCNFCYFRNSNEIERYRKSREEILRISENLATSGVHVIDLTMGEDSFYHEENFKSVIEIVKDIKGRVDKPVMLSPGVVPHKLIDQFADAGVEWYALYQETHNRNLFKNLRIEQDYDERMAAKLYARERGMLIEEGIMTGIGESYEDIADSILSMGDIGASQIRVMSFVPQQGSPMWNKPSPDPDLELKIIAIMRTLYPTALIPASLDVEGIDGLQRRMDAGANVVTSIIPPRAGLMGVAQSTKDVEEGTRTADEVIDILKELRLQPATQRDYNKFVSSIQTH